jgi:DNA-binding beta-propeller fold protein YncE
VAVDGSGNVYVADYGHNAVKEMPAGCTSSSCVTTLGGGFSYPTGVAVDGSGNVYVADYNNNAVKEMPAGCTSSSCVTTLGGGFSGPHWRGGGRQRQRLRRRLRQQCGEGDARRLHVLQLRDHAGRRLQQPEGVAVDGSGNVYVAD